MNEKIYAEQLYNGEIKIDIDNLSRDINILVRYCYQVLGFKKDILLTLEKAITSFVLEL